MFAAVIAAITAAATALMELITLWYKAAALLREAKKRGWIEEGRTLTQVIDGAKTDEERAILAKRLFDHIIK